MNTQTERTSLIRSESGQAAAVVAVFLFFVFMAFAALAIDGAMTYTVRRNLQNVADASALAACRVLSNGGTALAAQAEATTTVSSNLGAWQPYVGNNPPTSNQGSGTGLVYGLEISTSDVRVAVQRQVPTVLTQLLGRGPSNMVGKAHCNSTSGGGLLPIAIQRYTLTGDSKRGIPPMTDYLAKTGAPLYPNDSVTVTIPSPPARYLPYFQVPVPCGNPPNLPDSLCAQNYFASDSAVPGVPDANTGPEVALVGAGSQTNNTPNGFNSLVLLDIRNIAGSPIESYNGATGQQNTDKNISQAWIYQHGYPGPFPAVGSEIAVLDGVSVPFGPGAMAGSGYHIGDAVAAVVYDGYSWKKPSYTVSLQPTTSATGIVSGRAVTYTVTINNPKPSIPWPGGSENFDMVLHFSNPPAAGTQVTWNGTVLTATASSDYPFGMYNVIDTGNSGTLSIWNPMTTTVPAYLSGLNLYADSNLGLVQGARSNFGISGPIGSIPDPEYTVSTDIGNVFIFQGGPATVNLYAYSYGTTWPNTSCNAQVTADLYQNGVLLSGNGAWGNYFTSAQVQNITFNGGNTTQQLGFALAAANTAPATGWYTLRFTVGTSCGSLTIPSHFVEVPLYASDDPNVSANRFVFIQGYAVFRISGFTQNPSNPNTVWGYAISPLYQDLSQITVGLQSRLVPWN